MDLGSLLLAGLVTALRLVALPLFAVLVAGSLGWRWRRGRWLPLWPLAVALLVGLSLATAGFALAWHHELSPGHEGRRPRPAQRASSRSISKMSRECGGTAPTALEP